MTRIPIRKVRRHCEQAIAQRLGYPMPEAVRTIIRDPDNPAALLVDLNSGGNALACEPALRNAGYQVDDLGLSPTGYGVRIRVGLPVPAEVTR